MCKQEETGGFAGGDAVDGRQHVLHAGLGAGDDEDAQVLEAKLLQGSAGAPTLDVGGELARDAAVAQCAARNGDGAPINFEKKEGACLISKAQAKNAIRDDRQSLALAMDATLRGPTQGF